MSELSAVSGTPTATIKFYQREGLLPPSDKTAPNQADYGPAHVARLQLIRALLGVGKLSIAAAAEVIGSIDSAEPVLYTFEAAQNALSEHLDESDVTPDALAIVDAATTGWRVSPGNPGRLAAARVVDTFGALGQADEAGWFDRYAAAALLAAEADLDEIASRSGRDAQAETVVVGTVLGDALFSGLRRAAQEHVSSGRHPAPPHAASTRPNGAS
ncbi:MerR family transcriptional regulator [Subtercola sp. Z020]|uniref:MerR family transcriptional regulator n=1 Tax=Subtercola sp. Z020 TaxID=2080582 RepID=UPI001E2992AD|nr:MerR family transcriptional regulator [Subtercola sp. Z020]